MKNRNIIIISILICGIMLALFYYVMSHNKSLSSIADFPLENEVVVSVPSGIYAGDIDVSLSLTDSYKGLKKIVYTVDGSEPDIHSEKYTKPIKLPVINGMYIYTLKVAATFMGEISNVQTYTYIVGNGVADRMQVPVVSITSNNEDFYGDEEGILVPGKKFKEWIDKKVKNGELSIEEAANQKPSWGTPANFNDESIEHTAHITMFDTTGVMRIDQNCGISVAGNASRGLDVKSLRLRAGEEYDSSHDKFENVFDSVVGHRSNIYSMLKLRNGGGDAELTMLRDPLVSKLARECGFYESLYMQPVSVYINGNYYGMMFLSEAYTDGFLQRLYGRDKDDIEVYDVNDEEYFSLPGVGIDDDLEVSDIDFCDTEFREKFEKEFSIENMIKYYAFEMVIDNGDWPDHNVKVFRYKGKKKIPDTEMDGKYHFLVYDCDPSYNDGADRFEYYTYSGGEDCPLIKDGLSGYTQEDIERCVSKMAFLRKMMEYEPYRRKFVNYCLAFISGPVSEKEATQTLLDTYAEWGREYEFAGMETKYESVRKMTEEFGKWSDHLYWAVANREGEVLGYLDDIFDIGKTYKLYMEADSANDTLIVDGMRYPADGKYHERYVAMNYPVTISSDVQDGRRFAGYEINGELYTEKELELTPDYFENGDVRIKVISKPVQEAIVIEEVASGSIENYIKLKNVGSGEVNISNYYLSKKIGNLYKYNCPDIVLQPGESIYLYGKNCKMNGYRLNFSVDEWDTIYLSKKSDEETIDTVLVLTMTDKQVMRRVDGRGGFEIEHKE